MPWERGYYYRAKKVGGKVVREYVGKGEVAELIAADDAAEREARREEHEDQAERVRFFRADLERLDALAAGADEALGAVARAALLAAGFRQHHRGEWRRTRAQKSQADRTGH